MTRDQCRVYKQTWWHHTYGQERPILFYEESLKHTDFAGDDSRLLSSFSPHNIIKANVDVSPPTPTCNENYQACATNTLQWKHVQL